MNHQHFAKSPCGFTIITSARHYIRTFLRRKFSTVSFAPALTNAPMKICVKLKISHNSEKESLLSSCAAYTP